MNELTKDNGTTLFIIAAIAWVARFFLGGIPLVGWLFSMVLTPIMVIALVIAILLFVKSRLRTA